MLAYLTSVAKKVQQQFAVTVCPRVSQALLYDLVRPVEVNGATPKPLPNRLGLEETKYLLESHGLSDHSCRSFCKNVAILFGDENYTTRSTEPISIPNSIEAFATSTFRSPAFSFCSAVCRRSLRYCLDGSSQHRHQASQKVLSQAALIIVLC